MSSKLSNFNTNHDDTIIAVVVRCNCTKDTFGLLYHDTLIKMFNSLRSKYLKRPADDNTLPTDDDVMIK